MNRRSLREAQTIIALGLVLASGSAACSKDESKSAPATSSSWDAPKSATKGPAGSNAGAAASAPSSAAQAAASAALAHTVDGAAFAPLFPAAGPDGTTDKVARPPKQQSAEVTYKKGKDEYVTLLISDTAATPAVRDDYKAATDKLVDKLHDKLASYPLKVSGASKSAVLVADRFEVTASSPRLKPEERKAWLERVDLATLAKLAK